MIIVNQIIFPIFFVIKDVFVTQTIQLEGQKTSKPINCNQLIGFGRAEVRTLPSGVKIIYFSVGGIPFTAPATSANISSLSKFIPVYELEFDDECNMKEIEVSESVENKIGRNIMKTRSAHEVDEVYKNPKTE